MKKVYKNILKYIMWVIVALFGILLISYIVVIGCMLDGGEYYKRFYYPKPAKPDYPIIEKSEML